MCAATLSRKKQACQLQFPYVLGVAGEAEAVTYRLIRRHLGKLFRQRLELLMSKIGTETQEANTPVTLLQ